MMELSIYIARALASLRMVLFTFMNMSLFYYFLKKIFDLKRPPYFFVLHSIFKIVFITWFCVNIVYDWIQQSKYIYIAYNVFTLMQGIFLAIALWLTFRGDFIKIIILSMLAESVSVVIGLSSITLVNLLEGRNIRGLYRGRLEALDILTPIFAFVIFKILSKIGKPLFEKIHRYELKYSKFWGFVCVVFWSSGARSHQLQDKQSIQFYWQQMSFMIFDMVILLLLSGAYIYYLWKKQTLRKHQYLKKQKELMEIHIKAIQKQILWMEQAQKEMNRQMKEILALDCDEEKNQKFSMYLTQLKDQYKNMTAGMYCGDSLVDSVLYYFSQRFSKREISYEFSFQQYQSKMLPSEDAGELVFQLLNLVQTGPVSLKSQIIGNMLCFEFRCDGVKKKIIKKALSSLFQNYKVEVWQDKKERNNRYLIYLKA